MIRLTSLYSLRAGFLAAGGLMVSHTALPASDLDYFETHIRPVLVASCYDCHSEMEGAAKGGLVLDTRGGLMAGGESGAVVVPGNPEQSLLIRALRHQDRDLRMPPRNPLSAEVVKHFENWVRQGVAMPDDALAATISKEVDWEVARQFWAFQPVQAPVLPSGQEGGWALRDYDHLVLASLQKKGLEPSPDAERSTWLRRVTFDLTGLPPTPEALLDFLADRSSEAHARVVDRLLDSPAFGERWGRHWLDVARYGESSGMEVNILFPHAWRYRDYVIDAFNSDKPYNEFLTEQIAGDLLAREQPDRRGELITATGFLAIGPKSLNEANARQFAMDVVDEQLDTLTRATMALTVACARCHDHKFDPIPTRDYYAMAGIFMSSETHFGTPQVQGTRRGGSLIPIPVGEGTVVPGGSLTEAERERIEAQLEELREQRLDLFQEARNARRPGSASSNTADAARQRRQLIALGERIDLLERRLNAFDNQGNPRAFAMGLTERADPVDARILIRGEVTKAGDSVPRGLVQILDSGKVTVPEDQSGRLELARWIASPDNPLTARVMVNRVWSHLFGRGIVNSLDNFGETGQRPTHPELLDHLAARFVEQGWSVKKLVRELVLGRTYRQSSAQVEQAFKQDPENTLYWRMSPRRLEAEAIRDAMLQVSGELESAPPMASPVAFAGEGRINRFTLSQDLAADARYRSVYLPVLRDLVPEPLALFDFADPSLVIGQRDTTTVPSQGLYFLNDRTVMELSESFGQRLLSSEDGSLDRIRLAYRLAFGRDPSTEEFRMAGEFFKAWVLSRKAEGVWNVETLRDSSWSAFAQALFATAEFRQLY